MTAVVHTAHVTAWCREYAEKIARGEAEPFHAILCDPPAGIEFMGRAWDSFKSRPDHPASGEQTEEWDVNPGTPFARTPTPRFKGKARVKSPSWEQPFTEHGFSDGAERIAAPTIGRSAANPMCRVCHKHKRGWKDVPGCSCERPDFDDRDRVRSIRDNFVASMTDCFAAARACMVPGAHGFVWALPRTAHWTMTALDDAGFEVRDCCTHLFGSGFPKSLDVSKAIDRAAGMTRTALGPGRYNARRPTPPSAGFHQGGFAETLTAPATNAAREWSGYGSALKPAAEFWILVRNPVMGTIAANCQKHGAGALNIGGARIAGPDGDGHWSGDDGSDATSRPGYDGGFTRGGRRGGGGTYCGNRDENGKCKGHANAGRSTSGEMVHGPDTAPAERWPANICLSHVGPDENGEGGCVRVGTRRVAVPTHRDGYSSDKTFFGGGQSARQDDHWDHGDADGREEVESWRCVDGCPIRELDRQSGTLKSGDGPNFVNATAKGYRPNVYGATSLEKGHENVAYGNDGGASRFFHNSSWDAEVFERIHAEAPFKYQAKASRGERDAGLDGQPLVEGGVANDSGRGYKTKCGACGGYIARSDGAKPCVCAEPQEVYYRPSVLNGHPTVKPLSLAIWLAKLLLPPPHVAPRRLLNPFCGSGSEALGALLAGFEEVVGIEMSEEYAALARARLAFWEQHKDDDVAETVAAWQRSRSEQKATTASGQMGLFGVNKTDGHGV